MQQLQIPLKGQKTEKLIDIRSLRAGLQPLITQEVAMQAAIAASLRLRVASVVTKGNKNRRPGRSRQNVRRKVRLQARAQRIKRTAGHLTPVVSRTTEWSALLQKKIQPLGQRRRGLWQARSVQKMLIEERVLSA